MLALKLQTLAVKRLGQDLKNPNPNFGQDLARLNSTLGKLKIGWKRTRTTFLKRNVTSNKNKKKTKCDVDYMKTKWKLNKAFDNLLSLKFCVQEKDVYLNRTELEISDKKGTRKNSFN